MSLKYDEYGDIDYKAMYYELSEETKDYKNFMKMSRSTTWFIPVYCYLTSCIALFPNYNGASFFICALLALIPAAISIFIVSIIKTFLEMNYIHGTGRDIPLIFYLILIILSPIISHFLL